MHKPKFKHIDKYILCQPHFHNYPLIHNRSGLYEVKSSDQGHQKFFMKGNCPTRQNITMILLNMKNSGCA